ncbi:hypothetical protein QL285_005261 [Trifolium repens]|nr:hypothetical protein QL285_005261 [Trifolium repens]
MLRECQILLLPVTLPVEVPDRWQWWPDPHTSYSVRDAYHILTSQDKVTLEAAEDLLLWHKQVPLKVFILAWRLLRDRLPTKTNLVARGIFAPDLSVWQVVATLSLPNICSSPAARLGLFGH